LDLIKITDLTNQLGLTSRSLRYYEQAGLIHSVRPQFQKYRFYDEENIERLKQIIVLRKMQIPVKDIIRIYESEDMSVVVQTFVNRMDAIDGEIDALSEMKRITNEFLQTMIKNGIKKISALPLLYEEMERHQQTTFEELTALNEKLVKPLDINIIDLPSMRVISSYLKADPHTTDMEGFSRFAQTVGIAPGKQGHHERFEFKNDIGDIEIRQIPDDFTNNSVYLDYIFSGGLFAATNVYLDEDLGERFRTLIKSFNENKYFQIDYTGDGNLRHAAMLENLISPDDRRELVLLLVPVKKRLADPALFEKPKEVEPGLISIEEIEKQNPVLWSKDAAMDKLIPINNPHYRVTDKGEAEYISWIAMRVLSTDIAVKLPFRVDMEFRVGEESGGYGHGNNEGSVRFYHGEDWNFLFGTNMGNNPDERLSQEAICFHQPIFGDYYQYPKRGKINKDGYNQLTWIVGVKHFAVIINGEIRYCGINLPYMALDLSRHEARPILVGSDSSLKRYFKSIRVSQLLQMPKIKIGNGALTTVTKQSNNIIPKIHKFISSEYGENYHFNGGARYVMESLGEYTGEPDFGYCMFSGLTGDVLAQVYAFGNFRGDGVTDYMIGNFDNEVLNGSHIENIFQTCGYESTVVFKKDLVKNREMYVQKLISYIDKGIPVIEFGYGTEGSPWGVFVGYEEHGKELLFLTHNAVKPAHVPIDETLKANWILVGQKKEQKKINQLYRGAILNMPGLLTTKTDDYCFGAAAFRAWANDIESGKYDHLTPNDWDAWRMYTVYICNLATNGSCASSFLDRAWELNPDFAFLEDVIKQYKRTAEIWNNDKGEDLEALGGGFNVTLEALQNIEKRRKIASKIRECAEVMDDVVRILNKNLIL
jgi:DNA-binding transcriptional MerR regulator